MNLHDLKLEFVSYDGSYPNLCSGTLVFTIGNKEYRWDHCLSSGGGITENYESTIQGPWSVDFPDDFPDILRPAVTEMVNENVQHGCCGGCI